MYAKQIAVMKGQAWNVVETLKTPDHGPLELTRRARVCVWDDLVEIPIVVPLRAPSAEMRRRQSGRSRPSTHHEEMDITALSTPPQKPKSDPLIMHSPPLELANENRFNLSRESSSMDVHDRQENARGSTSPVKVQALPRASRAASDGPSALANGNGRPSHRPRMSYEDPRRHRETDSKRHRRYSLTAARRGHGPMFVADDDDDGDLGFAANDDLEENHKMVIVERLEMVKSKNPVFTWC